MAALGCEPSAAHVVAGVAHTCVLDEGEVRCWGDNSLGQLGRDASEDAVAPSLLALPQVRALDAGGDTTCALDDDGRAWCFGADHHGQLGDGARDARSTPALVPGLPPIRDVSVGHAHVCALARDGGVWCWGWNGSGQSIPGGPPDVDVPARVEGLPPVGALVAGYSDTCAITGERRALCWGAISGGSIAEITDDVSAVAVGVDYVCAARSDEVRCFGAEPGGARPALPPEGRSYDVAASTVASALIDHVCAIDGEGRLSCWGKNDAGQLGDATLRFATARSHVVGIDGLVHDVATGHQHTCALAGASTYCWGANDRGQLGEPGALGSLSPVLVP
jgi:alpha-tubulin suppressor-like RCC1 family protein